MSNLWCACLTTDTRRPRSLSAGIRRSTSVVLPEPEKPAKPTTFMRSLRVRRSASDEAFDRAAASAGSTVTRLGRCSMPSNCAGRSGSRPSASTMVAANLIGSAVSSTIIGTPGCRCSRATFRPSAVWVSIIDAEALVGVADGGQAVGVRALAADEAVAARAACANAGSPPGRTGPCAASSSPNSVAHPRAVAAQQVEHEALEVAGLGDVHRRAGGLVRVGAAAHAVDAGAEELVEHVVLVGGQHQLRDRQAHHARHVAGADVAEVAGGHGEADLARSFGAVASPGSSRRSSRPPAPPAAPS